MIVVTLLLILVAVTLLVLGLADGSSSMLIGSIVASLLAAVALVIGARRAATLRRASEGVPQTPEADPFLAEPPGEFATAGARTSTGPAGTHTTQGARAADRARRPGDLPPPAADDFPLPPPAGDAPGDFPSSPAGGAPGEFPSSPAGEFPPPPGPVGDYAPVGREDFLPPPPGSSESRGDDFPLPPPPAASVADEFARPPATAADEFARPADEFARPADEFARPSAAGADEFARPSAARAGRSDRDVGSDFSASDPILDDEDDDLLEPEPGTRPTRDRAAAEPGDESGARSARDHPAAEDAPGFDASSVIGSARSESRSEAWRTDPTLTDPGTRTAEPFDDEPLLLDEPASDQAGPSGRGASSPGSTEPDDDEEEFAEADEDDPADEPLPQAVHPGDAVRVARMDAEVLVVDGRPRYHLADCPHLVGRLTEGLPVSEAVELGFNPCGLCRPVDRLVARSHHA